MFRYVGEYVGRGHWRIFPDLQQLTFNEAGRPEMPKQVGSSPETGPSRCPSLVYSPQDQVSMFGEIIFEGLVSKDKGVRRRDQNRASYVLQL